MDEGEKSTVESYIRLNGVTYSDGEDQTRQDDTDILGGFIDPPQGRRTTVPAGESFGRLSLEHTRYERKGLDAGRAKGRPPRRVIRELQLLGTAVMPAASPSKPNVPYHQPAEDRSLDGEPPVRPLVTGYRIRVENHFEPEPPYREPRSPPSEAEFAIAIAAAHARGDKARKRADANPVGIAERIRRWLRGGY